MTPDLPRSLQEIQDKIRRALHKSSRDPKDVTLIAVSKKKPADLIRAAFQSGVQDIGENYVQELLGKQNDLAPLPVRWHFIGHLQRRKAKEIVGKVSLIHSLASAELAEEINKSAKKLGIVQECLLQIHMSDEAAKSGIPPQGAKALLESLKKLENVSVLGLMALPPYFEDSGQVRPFFKRLRELRDELNGQTAYSSQLTHLSMGMSHDFEVAIEEGATFIRVGSALFGNRI